MSEEQLLIPETPDPTAAAAAYAAALEQYREDMARFERDRLAAQESRKSSELEYDRLTVYLAGGGLVLTIGFVKDLMQLTKSDYLGWLLFCWILFSLCLIVSLLAHFLAKKSFDSYLNEEEELVQKRKRGWVDGANIVCFGLVTGGIFAFIIFVSLNILYHA